MKNIYLFWLVLGFASAVNAQGFLQPQEYQQRLNNGLHLFYTQIPGATQNEVLLSYRFGSMAEDSTTDGLAYVCHTVFLQGLQKALKTVDANLKVDGRFGFEVSTYRFLVPKPAFEKALNAIADFYSQKPDSATIAAAILQNETLFTIAQNTVMYPAEQALLARQWTTRSPAMTLYGSVPVADTLTIRKVQKMYKNGYCMEFALMAFTGSDNFRILWRKVQDVLGPVNTCKNELFTTKLANLFPKPKFSSQMVYNVGSATPTRYQKMFHGPYVAFDTDAALAAMVLKTILTQSTAIDKRCDSLGISQLRLAYEPMQFATSLTWHIFPTTDSMHVAYSNFDTLMLLLADSNIISAEDIETAKNTLLTQFESLRNDPANKSYLIAQLWAQNSLPWLGDYPALLKKINHDEISKLIKNYVLQQKYSSLLLLNITDSASYNLLKYTTTYISIDSVNFYFQKNTAKFASATDDSTLNTLVQTLLINKDLSVSLNAQAYKSELVEVKDDSLATQLKQFEGYYLYPPNLLSTKSYRLDIYRTAKLIIMLAERGVAAGQLKGTGVLLKGEEGKETYKVSVTALQ